MYLSVVIGIFRRISSGRGQVIREVNARFVYGLTATPIRKDGHQPIIFMQCGEIRYTADSKSQQTQQSFRRLLIPRFTSRRNLKADGGNYAQVIDELIESESRNKQILDDIASNLAEGRTPIILTARTAHVDLLAEECRQICPNVFRLVGNDSAKTKREVMEQLSLVPADEPLVVVATGKYVGEGFDLPRLDTLMLALPVSWKGLIAQYTGRLHRNYPGKSETRIYDYIDLRVPICDSMYRKRLHGYKAVGYSIAIANEGLFAEPTTETIFDTTTFERPFHEDLSKARLSIVISIPMPAAPEAFCSLRDGQRIRNFHALKRNQNGISRNTPEIIWKIPPSGIIFASLDYI